MNTTTETTTTRRTTRKRRYWTVVTFGRHSGKTLPEIALLDPNWLFWAHDADVFADKGTLAAEASEVCDKARRIRVPDDQNGRQAVKYSVNPKTKKYEHIELIPEAQRSVPQRTGIIRDTIDLAFPRTLPGFDKTGGTRLVSDMKEILFGDADRVLTTSECEQFFDDDNNFLE